METPPQMKDYVHPEPAIDPIKGKELFACDGLRVYQFTDGRGEPMAFVSVLGRLGASLSPQDCLTLSDVLGVTFQGFRA